MKDMIPNGDGSSRFLKSAVPSGTTWEQALAMLRAGTFPIDLHGINPDGVTQEGSAYSKANVLPDSLCDSLWLNREDAEPKDALSVLSDPARFYVWEKKSTQFGSVAGYTSALDPSTYPADGKEGAWWYTRCGMLGAWPRVAFGSYVGKGLSTKSGEDKPRSISTRFRPALILISDGDTPGYIAIIPAMSLSDTYKSDAIFNFHIRSTAGTFQTYAKIEGFTVTWYAMDSNTATAAAERQFDVEGRTYNWIAIGTGATWQ